MLCIFKARHSHSTFLAEAGEQAYEIYDITPHRRIS